MSIEENRLEGHVDRIENGWVFGWAWNSDSPNDPIEVEIYVDGKRQATAMANLYRADLETVGIGKRPARFRGSATRTIAGG